MYSRPEIRKSDRFIFPHWPTINSTVYIAFTELVPLYGGPADDTTTYAQGNTVLEIEADMQSDVNNISAWFCSNKLTVNTDQSGTMLVRTRQKQQSANHFNVTMNQNILEDYTEVPYLDLILSDTISCA